MQDLNTTAITVRQSPTPAYLPTVTPEAIEQALAIGDLARMSPEVRVAYYIATCQSAGLNPMTRPFDLIKGDDGTVRLYPNKVAAEQLRKLHRVSIRVLERRVDTENGLYIVTVVATTPDGREDEAQGIVDIVGKKGTALANQMLKAETKSKRRATLSLCGLGYDDSEDAGGHPVHYDYQQGTLPQESAVTVTRSLAPMSSNPIADLYGEPRDIPNFTREPAKDRQAPATAAQFTNSTLTFTGDNPGAKTRQAPPQTEILGVEDDDIPPQVRGGEMYIDQLTALMTAHGETPDAIQAFWHKACQNYKVSSPVAIPRSALPKMLTNWRAHYEKQAKEDAQAEQARQEADRVPDDYSPNAEPAPWRTTLANAALAVPESEEALHKEIAAALYAVEMPDAVGQELLRRVQGLLDELAAAMTTGEA